MTREQIRDLFESLAQSQGLYGRLLNSIDNLDEEQREKYWEYMEEQKFTDVLDVILFIET